MDGMGFCVSIIPTLNSFIYPNNHLYRPVFAVNQWKHLLVKDNWISTCFTTTDVDVATAYFPAY